MDDEAARCRVVNVEWDRGHESFDCILRAESREGVIVTPIHDLSALAGWRWIRRSEILEITDLDPSSPVVRLANLRGTRDHAANGQLCDPTELLAFLEQQGCLIAIYSKRTGSAELFVGILASLGSGHVLDHVDAEGQRSDDATALAVDELIAVDWGTTYLADLAELLTAERQREP